MHCRSWYRKVLRPTRLDRLPGFSAQREKQIRKSTLHRSNASSSYKLWRNFVWNGTWKLEINHLEYMCEILKNIISPHHVLLGDTKPSIWCSVYHSSAPLFLLVSIEIYLVISYLGASLIKTLHSLSIPTLSWLRRPQASIIHWSISKQ